MNESTDQIPPDAESIRRNQIDMDFFKGTILPVIERHGMDRGGKNPDPCRRRDDPNARLA